MRAVQGDFGQSHYLKKPVAEVIFERLPTTMLLGVCALAFALTLSIPLGVLAAIRPNSLIDRVALTIAVVGQAMPSFWFALTLMLWFGIYWRLLPITGTAVLGEFRHAVDRARLLHHPGGDAPDPGRHDGGAVADYIRTARAKGLRPMTVLFKHALRNAIIPVVSLAAVQFGFMLGGSIVIETIFAINGLGFLAWESIQRADLPMMQAIVLVLSIFYIVLTFLADMLNAWLDPTDQGGMTWL